MASFESPSELHFSWTLMADSVPYQLWVQQLLRWAALSCMSLVGFSQAITPHFTSGVTLVRVEALVTVDGTPLRSLNRDDFRVRENDDICSVVHINTERDPLDIVLLLDVSLSMESNIRDLTEGATAAIKPLVNGDRLAIITFAWKPRVVLKLTDDLPYAASCLASLSEKLTPRGATYTTSALDRAAALLKNTGRRNARKAVVILSDNMGAFKAQERRSIRHLWEADTNVNALIAPGRADVLNNPGHVYPGPKLWCDLVSIAHSTAGFTSPITNASAAVATMFEQLRTSYSVYFRPHAGTPGVKRLAVVELAPEFLARNPNARVRGSREYVLQSVE